mmetsp:Transcript_32586/g.56474  ORF Transcript_32586/g.56474 Transcript_32586/m.56474 type:complete len:327 (-) Transcript_32586:6180-7160(-)
MSRSKTSSMNPLPQTPPKPEQLGYSPQTYLEEIEEENRLLQAELARMDGDIAVTYDYDFPKQVRNSPHSATYSPNRSSVSSTQDQGGSARVKWESDQRKFEVQETLPMHDCSRQSMTSKTKAEKAKVLEVRLKGAMEAIKNLERMLKERDDQLHRCEEELARKTKLLESAQAQHISLQSYQKTAVVQSSLTSLIRKKEKAMEKRLKEQDAEIIKQKKTMNRLQQLNNTLLTKIKQCEQRASEVDTIESHSNKQAQYIKSLKEACGSHEELAKNLETKLKETEGYLEQSLKKYEELLKSSMEFEERTRDLYRANQVLHENLLRLLDV